MLILSRKRGEVIRIGNDIEITVMRISGENVRIGIDAPKEMNIVRTELSRATTGSESDPRNSHEATGRV